MNEQAFSETERIQSEYIKLLEKGDPLTIKQLQTEIMQLKCKHQFVMFANYHVNGYRSELPMPWHRCELCGLETEEPADYFVEEQLTEMLAERDAEIERLRAALTSLLPLAEEAALKVTP